MHHRLSIPSTDPEPIFEVFNANFGNKIMVAAASHFSLFEKLASGPRSYEDLRGELGVAERPMSVLITAMRSFGVVFKDAMGDLRLTELGRNHLVPGADCDVSDYLELAADARGVKDLVERLRTNTPAGDDLEGKGAQYVFDETMKKSAMRDKDMASWLTERLAGRAKSTALKLARVAPLKGPCHTLLDVGGGTGIFAVAYLQENPELRVTVLELPEVAPVARKYATHCGVSDRMEFVEGDMFNCDFPRNVDAILLSNVLHDWDVPECRHLVARCATALRPGGRLMIHDAFLNDELDGPHHIAIYSVILFYLTKGRAYSAAEYRQWLGEVGLVPQAPIRTMVHCSVLSAFKSV